MNAQYLMGLARTRRSSAPRGIGTPRGSTFFFSQARTRVAGAPQNAQRAAPRCIGAYLSPQIFLESR